MLKLFFFSVLTEKTLKEDTDVYVGTKTESFGGEISCNQEDQEIIDIGFSESTQIDSCVRNAEYILLHI